MSKKRDKTNRRAMRQSKVEEASRKAREGSLASLEEPPNNSLGLPNTFYERHHVRIEQQRRDTLASQAINLAHMRFHRYGELAAQSFEEAFIFIYHYLIEGRKKCDNEVMVSHTSNVKNGSYLISADSILLGVTDSVKAFRHVLGLKLLGIISDEDSIYFTFQPDPNDNDQCPIRLDFDFTFPDLKAVRYRTGEMLFDIAYQELVGLTPILCWYEVNESQPDIIFHVCFSNGKFLHVAYNDIDMYITMDEDWQILKSLPEAIQVGIEDGNPF